MATKRTVSKSPPAAPGSRRAHGKVHAEDKLGWALAAFARVLRPVIRLALAFGAKHAQLEELLRDLLIDEARRAWRAEGVDANISQLSVTTGLNRKAVTAKVRDAEGILPRTEMSSAAKTLTLWLQMLAGNKAYRSLPLVSEGKTPSFDAVARRASRGNVHHRTILDELARLGMVLEQDGRVELVAAAFVPANDLKEMLSFLGDNARDHLLAGVSNTLGARPPLLERSVFANGVSMEDCERIHQLARERWQTLHHELTEEMTRAFEAADASAPGRIRVGIYTYLENADGQQAGAPVAVPSTRSGNKS